jgi:hypothetical protein
VDSTSLAPLDRSQVRDMVAELSARHALPQEVVEDVAARTGGVPLFVEEVTRLLLERGGEQGGIHAIPPTLQQSLTARLDRLGSAREVAQIGAVIGRDFSYKLLREIAGIGDAPLQAALERLADADILLVQGLPPTSDYRFKHALIQDAAYENLLKSRRQALHRLTAEVLRDQFADTATAEPALLAHHFTQAGMTEVSNGGALRDSARWREPHLLKGQSSSNGRLTRSRPCRLRRLCVARRSSLKSLSRMLWRSRATMSVAKSTMTGRSRSTILPNTVRLRRVLAGISGWPSWRLARRVCGSLDIPRLHAVMLNSRSRKRAKPVMPQL